MNLHPYLRYAHALICVENNLDPFISYKDLPYQLLLKELENGINHFRVKARAFEGMNATDFDYTNEAKGDTNKGIYLASSIISSDKAAGNFYKACIDCLTELKKKEEEIKKYFSLPQSASMSCAPTSGEFLGFTAKGGISRSSPKISTHEYILGLISGSTPTKPSMAYKTYAKKKNEYKNVTLVPDLPIEELINFIKIFKLLLFRGTTNLMKGSIYKELTTKGEVKYYKPMRPVLFNGNFPNAPKSSALGHVALLGAIGEFTKEHDTHALALQVLESLKNAEIYMIRYGDSNSFKYNHHVVDLAKSNRLSTIIDSIYYSVIYKDGYRSQQNREEYQRFDLFTGRFLLLFNNSSFRDFLSFRAEYPSPVQDLFKTYFIKMEKIKIETITSARAFGKWLNLAAYITAKNEVKEDAKNYNQKVREWKSKVLVELESAAFSAKSPDALIAQLMTRVGRLSQMDAPEITGYFMEATLSGEITLDQAKNMIIAFMRLRNKQESKEIPLEIESEEESETMDVSDAQE